MSLRVLLVLCLGLGFVEPAAAQSLFNSAGIGLPADALDGRARALGNLGIGLRDNSFMPTDPGSVGRFFIPTGVMVGQPTWVDFSRDGGASGSFQGTRFPLVGISYPLFSGMMSLQIGSFLDQRYETSVLGTVDLQGTTFPTLDTFEQDGSVSTLNLGYARRIGDRIAAGVSVGRYAGSLVRQLTRSFDDAVIGVEDYVERGTWSYGGYALTAGVSMDVSEIVRVAGSVQLPTGLEATASDDTDGADRSFDVPIQYRLGASGQLAPGLVVAASAVLADWSSVEGDLVEPTRVGSASGFGVGIELTRARLLGRDAPLRFGYRRTGLPFSFGEGSASERIFAGGFGLALNETNDVLLAGADFALERGRRTGGGVTENFWRLTISLIVSGS